MTIFIDGKVGAIVGVVREPNFGKFFSDVSDELQPHLKSITVVRAIKASMEIVRSYRGPVVSVAEHAEGCSLLNRLGFAHLDGAYYLWPR